MRRMYGSYPPPLLEVLSLPRCPHCRVADPNLAQVSAWQTNDALGQLPRLWRAYSCKRCGGAVVAWALQAGQTAQGISPEAPTVDADVPARARTYLSQAIDSIHAPAGAVMLAASAVDAMLKEKGLKDGSLYSRIDAASASGLITKEMAEWAHEVRLDANDQRHSDENVDLPTEADAQKCVDFAQALGQFLFVLPARVARGRASTKK